MRTYNDIILDLISLIQNKELTKEEADFFNGIVADYYILTQYEENDDADFENLYKVTFKNNAGIRIKTYEIEADDPIGAETAAREFFADDFPLLFKDIDNELTKIEFIRKVI